MEITMKKCIGLSALILVFALVAGTFSACKKAEKAASDELVFCVQGERGSDIEKRLQLISDGVKEKTGYSINFRFLSDEAYDLVISSDDNCDLIFAADYKNYWQNAASGAFAEITDADMEKNAPFIWKNSSKDALNSSKLNGKRYGVVGMSARYPDRCFAVRGDLMEKYGIESIGSIEDMEKFLTAVAENEKGIIPYDTDNGGYQMLLMFGYDWGWAPVGSLDWGQHVYFRLDDPEHKIFIAAEQPEMLEMTKTMKRWNEKGFFSKSVLSNTKSSLDSFKAGRSAIAAIYTPEEAQGIWSEFENDERKAWNVKFIPRYHRQQMNNWGGFITAISAKSKKKDAALAALNAIYSSEKLIRLVELGEEGVNYKILDNGKMEKIPTTSTSWINTGIRNGAFIPETNLTFPGAEELVAELKEMGEYNPAVNCPISDEAVREVKVAMTEVYNSYTNPRYFGIIDGTPEAALKKEVDKLKKAGIERYIENMQTQLDAYMKELEE